MSHEVAQSMKQYEAISEHANLVSKTILDCCFFVHTQLGPGLLESVYEECVFHFLKAKNLEVERQKPVPIQIADLHLPCGLRLDLLVENEIILELKAVERILPIHEAQIHTYLKLSGKRLGLLVNFNVRSLKDGIIRIVR